MKRLINHLRTIWSAPTVIAKLEARVEELEGDLRSANRDIEKLEEDLQEATSDAEDHVDEDRVARMIESAVEDLDFASQEGLDDLERRMERECAEAEAVSDLGDKVEALTTLAGLANYGDLPINEALRYETVEADIRRACEELGFGFKEEPRQPPSRGILLREEGRAQ
jgi:predicted RNase H-like nuclease (RuvC/YqgF family)